MFVVKRIDNKSRKLLILQSDLFALQLKKKLFLFSLALENKKEQKAKRSKMRSYLITKLIHWSLFIFNTDNKVLTQVL